MFNIYVQLTCYTYTCCLYEHSSTGCQYQHNWPYVHGNTTPAIQCKTYQKSNPTNIPDNDYITAHIYAHKKYRQCKGWKWKI